jgi:hypothetical protein
MISITSTSKNMFQTALKPLGTLARLLGTVVIMIIAFMISTTVFRSDVATQLNAAEVQQSGQVLLLVSAVNALLLSYLALRSRWHGWKLAGTLFLVQFGIETFMSQIETIIFNGALQLTASQVFTIFASGFVRALIFAPLAVWILGKNRRDAAADEPNTRLTFSLTGWAQRLGLLGVLYVIVYFLFGYFVAWQSADLREFYSGSREILPFFTHMARLMTTTDPLLTPIQFVRGLMWVGLALPIVRMFKGGKLETCLAVALTLSILLAILILFPNPYMPEAVRMAHFTELWSSMALFGALTGWVLMKKTLPFVAGKPS